MIDEQCCKTCIYWKPTKYLKAFGDCESPKPFWVVLDNQDYITHKDSGSACVMYKKDQNEGN